MKKLFTSAVLLITVTMLFAQPEVTKFLGIPVDGTKSEMISKLKAKGYTWNSTLECLEGEFNGRDVKISVVTNNNKVYRIAVFDKNYSNETDIRIRYNTLLRQFEKNDRYMTFSKNEYIDENEDIHNNISYKNKRYQASFFQYDEKFYTDSVYLTEQIQKYLLDNYSEEEIVKMSETITENIDSVLLEVFNYLFSDNSVWFMIDEEYGKYRILLFYDNNRNAANGDDL